MRDHAIRHPFEGKGCSAEGWNIIFPAWTIAMPDNCKVVRNNYAPLPASIHKVQRQIIIAGNHRQLLPQGKPPVDDAIEVHATIFDHLQQIRHSFIVNPIDVLNKGMG